jgi:hypothetical protein
MLRRIGRQGYTTVTCDDHNFGLNEEATHRFRTNRRWYLMTVIVERAGFYQLPDSDKVLHGDIPSGRRFSILS